MKRLIGLSAILLSVYPLTGCGDDDDAGSDPVALCKEGAKTICSKFYGCYTDEQLDLAAAVVGNNEADCVTKWSEDLKCTTEGVKCDSGQTYDSAKAQECLSQYKSFSCEEFTGFASGATVKPAACDQTCK